MRRLFPLDTDKTLVMLLLEGETPEAIIEESLLGEQDGCDGVLVELPMLKPEYRNRESLAKIVDALHVPVKFNFYRRDPWGGLSNDEEGRMAVLLEAAEAGAGMIDIIGDLFDPSSDEITRDEQAIRHQMAVIEQIHGMGVQVTMSSHPLRRMSAEETLRQLQSFAERGADVVKVVANANTEEEFAESINTFAVLKAELDRPFIYLCAGKYAIAQRLVGLQLGSFMTMAIHDYHPGPYTRQPLITVAKGVQAALNR